MRRCRLTVLLEVLLIIFLRHVGSGRHACGIGKARQAAVLTAAELKIRRSLIFNALRVRGGNSSNGPRR